MKQMSWLLDEAWGQRKLLALAFLLIFCFQGLRLIQPLYFQDAVDLAHKPEHLNEVLWISNLILALMVLSQIVQTIQAGITSHASLQISQRLRLKLFRHVLKLPLAYHKSVYSGQFVVRMTSDLETLAETISTSLIRIGADLVAILFIFGILFTIHVKLTLLVLCLMPLLYLVGVTLGRMVQEGYLVTKKLLSEMATSYTEIYRGLISIQALGRQNYFTEWYGKTSRHYTNQYHRVNRMEPSYYSFVEFFSSFLLAVILAYSTGLLQNLEISFGALVAYLSYIQKVLMPLRQLSGYFAELQNAKSSFSRIHMIFAKEEEASILREPSVASEGDLSLTPLCLEMRDLVFSYGDEIVLKGINLKVKEGEKIGLVGRTGSGKSTLFRLINRFYVPDSGELLFRGRPIQEIPVAHIRDQTGLILQDTALFQGTIRENIALFEERQLELSEQYLKHLVNMHSFREKGLDTQIVSAGGNFSVGERQFIAFGRIFQKKATIFLLDEATASMDSLTEEALQEALNEFLPGRTALVIAHRLSTLKLMDRILVLKDGLIVEEGSYQNLLEAGGEFFKFHQQGQI